MIVVADTTPLNYLILIEQARILPRLYGRVIIPEAVAEELRHHSAPPPVSSWIARPPAWLEIQKARRPKPDAALDVLDEGEREAIILALEIHAHLLLIDEKAGRREAGRRHLQVAGTLAVLEQAAKRGLLDFPKVLRRLEKTNFRLSADIIESFRARNPKRKP